MLQQSKCLTQQTFDARPLDGVPVLLKQYLKLGGKILAFNVDKEFNNALDGLIVVDLLEGNKRMVHMYMGKDGYETFASHHREKPEKKDEENPSKEHSS